MAGQSLAMGEAFGKGFQYGKRRISSMSNEEFNALTAEGMAKTTFADINSMIPSMESSVKNSDRLQSEIIQAMGDLVKSLPQEFLDFFANIGETSSPSGISTVRYDRSGVADRRGSDAPDLGDVVSDIERKRREEDKRKASGRSVFMIYKDFEHTFPLPTGPSPFAIKNKGKRRLSASVEAEMRKHIVKITSASNAIAGAAKTLSRVETGVLKYKNASERSRRIRDLQILIASAYKKRNRFTQDLIDIRTMYV